MLSTPPQSKLLLALPTKLAANNSVNPHPVTSNHQEGTTNFPSMRTTGSSRDHSFGKQPMKLSPSRNRVSSSIGPIMPKASSRSDSRPLSTKIQKAKAPVLSEMVVMRPKNGNVANRSVEKPVDTNCNLNAKIVNHARRKTHFELSSAQYQLNDKAIPPTRKIKPLSNKSAEDFNAKTFGIKKPRLLVNGNQFALSLVQSRPVEFSNRNLAHSTIVEAKPDSSSKAIPIQKPQILAKTPKTQKRLNSPIANSKAPLSSRKSPEKSQPAAQTNLQRKISPKKIDGSSKILHQVKNLSSVAKPIKSTPHSRQTSTDKLGQHLDEDTQQMLADPLKFIQKIQHISHESITKLQENLKRVDTGCLQQFVSQHNKDINYNSRRNIVTNIPEFFAINLIHTKIVNELEQRKKLRSRTNDKSNIKPVKLEKVSLSPDTAKKAKIIDCNHTQFKTPGPTPESLIVFEKKNSLKDLRRNNRTSVKQGLLPQPLSGVINKQGLHSSKFSNLKQTMHQKPGTKDREAKAECRADSHDRSWMKKPMIISTDNIGSNNLSTLKINIIPPDFSEDKNYIANARTQKLQSGFQMTSIAKSRTSSPNHGETLPKDFSNQQPNQRTALIDEILRYVSNHKSNPPTNQKFYKFEREIAQGYYGRIMLAHSILANKPVAIKCFDKSAISSPNAARKIQQEIAAHKLASDHPNICQLYETFEDEQCIYMVLEYADGGDLATRIKRLGRMQEAELISLLKQMLSVLQYLQNKQLLHRDIKLENILINSNSEIKLCDFGIAVSMQPSRVITEHVGTPVYLAPEVVSDNGYSGFKSDIWSLGVACFIALTGDIPFKGGSLEKLEESIVNESTS
jgi:hypothetical protein